MRRSARASTARSARGRCARRPARVRPRRRPCPEAIIAAGCPPSTQPPVLIGHQRDQRRDHDRQLVGGDAGQLVAEALAAAGRHHHEAVATRERRGHRLALPGPELVQAEVREQRIRVAGPVVAALGRGVDVDPVQAAERELGLRPDHRLARGGGAARARASASARAAPAASARSESVERAPQRPAALRAPPPARNPTGSTSICSTSRSARVEKSDIDLQPNRAAGA